MAPFFLMFSFDNYTPKYKGKKDTTGVPRYWVRVYRADQSLKDLGVRI